MTKLCEKAKALGLAAIAAGLFTACAHSPLAIPDYRGKSPNVDYKYELEGDVNGATFNGVGILYLSKDNHYRMHVESKTDVNFMTVSTCNRFWYDQDHPIQQGGLFEPHKEFNYDFHLIDGLENLGTCLVQIGAYNRNGDPQQWAVLEVLTPDATLPAVNKCDGDQGQTQGVSICQSMAGLDQEIDFDVPVEIADAVKPECRPQVPKDGKHWVYTLPNSRCTIDFFESAPPHRKHRHTFQGFKTIQLKGR